MSAFSLLPMIHGPGQRRRPVGAAGALALSALVATGALIAWALPRPPSVLRLGSTRDVRSVGVMVPVSPPREVPALTFVDGLGQTMTLRSFAGRAVLLNLWATWCVPCREEMPSLDRLQAWLGGPAFVVVPMSIDRQGAAVVAPFYRELRLTTLGIYLDVTGKAPSLVSAEGIPTTLLIAADGREVARVAGAAVWDSPEMITQIRAALKLPAPSSDEPTQHKE